MKRLLAVAVAVGIGAAVLFLRPAEHVRDGRGEAPCGHVARRPGRSIKSAPVIRTKPVLGLLSVDDEDGDKRSPAERRLAEAIEKALDEEDLELARSCAKEAVDCRSAEIRQAMVDTLGWFGEKAIVELLPFMADADEDVAESARNGWETGVAEVEDARKRLDLVGRVMGIMTDEDFLESVSGEYIGIDEKLAVESLLSVIEGGGSAAGIAKAKETYEFVTGEEFVDRAAAEKWVAEEYEPEVRDDGL